MKKTYFLSVSSLLLLSVLIACQNGNNNNGSQPMQRQVPPSGLPGQPIGPTQHHDSAKLGNASDDVVFKTDKNTSTAYNANDYTHVVNPHVKPTFTGLSTVNDIEFTDAGNDNLMEKMRQRLASRKESSILNNQLDPAAKNIDAQVIENDLAFAKSITMAELRRTSDEGQLEMHFWIADEGEFIFKSPAEFTEEGTRKSALMTMEAVDETSKDYSVQASCVTRVSNLNDADLRKRACQTVVAQITNNGKMAYIIFRTLPAKIFLGEYTSRVLKDYHGDPILDRWTDFFWDVMTYNRVNVGSLSDSNTIADVKSFAVANGISAFTLSINRGQHGKFVVSGDLAASQKNLGQKINLPLERGVHAGTEDQVIDYISETVTDATLVHANGRGMLHILVQVGNINDATDPDSGGVIFNQKSLTQSGIGQANLFRRNFEARFSFAARNKSLRLQEKTNRALRFTVVPVLNAVNEPVFK